ncbi:hypothetical protein CEXT_314991 [Caerostris extrusa]|uniref:Uncharacterized protein n=1 Tax=Caerostris extrusa TaxID=172846 RepID=A0AAV4S6M8_CAEEX|nr:hypothetical protein CEXT_314991 [Caerostris extrusa]
MRGSLPEPFRHLDEPLPLNGFLGGIPTAFGIHTGTWLTKHVNKFPVHVRIPILNWNDTGVPRSPTPFGQALPVNGCLKFKEAS